MRNLAWTAALLLGAGCYSYARTPAGAPVPVGPVRVTLADSARGALAPQIGPAGAVLQGQAVGTAPDGSLSLAVTQVTRANGVDEFWRGERVHIPAAALTRIEVRRFDRRRTALLAAGLVGGVVLARAFGGSEASLSGGGRPPGPGGSN